MNDGAAEWGRAVEAGAYGVAQQSIERPPSDVPWVPAARPAPSGA